MSKRNKIVNEVIEQILYLLSTKYGINSENVRKDIKDVPKNLECQYINEKTGKKCGVVLYIHHKQEEKEENNNEYFPKEYSTIYKGLNDVIKESIMFSIIDSIR